MRNPVMLATGCVLTALGLQACEQLPDALTPEQPGSAPYAAAASKALDVDRCAFSQAFSLSSANTYFPLAVGSQWRLEGDEDGVHVVMRITVLDETEVVGGVTTRVVEEAEWEDDELLEISRNFFAATQDGTVCYFGEEVDIYEDEQVVSHEGAWRADAPGNFPGIIMPSDPRPGMRFLMEGAPGIAQDAGKVVGSGPTSVPAGLFRSTLRIQERGALPGDFDFKVYAEGVGIIIDGPLSLESFASGGGNF
jgi:hypothetical protein